MTPTCAQVIQDSEQCNPSIPSKTVSMSGKATVNCFERISPCTLLMHNLTASCKPQSGILLTLLWLLRRLLWPGAVVMRPKLVKELPSGHTIAVYDGFDSTVLEALEQHQFPEDFSSSSDVSLVGSKVSFQTTP